MKTTLKKAMSWVLLLSMIFSLAAAMVVGVSADEPDHVTYGAYLGTAGDNIKVYYKSESGQLTFVGSGEMKDYVPSGVTTTGPASGDRCWVSSTHNYRTKIKSIVVGEGITSIGNGAFWGLDQCTSVQLPDTLENIGEWAFCRMSALGSIVIPKAVTLIERFAFYDAGLLSKTPKSTCLGSPKIINEHYIGGTTNSWLVNDLDDESKARIYLQAEGYVGGLSWVYNSVTGVLAITNPRSELASMDNLIGIQQWEDYLHDINTVLIGDNIRNVGAGAFTGATSLTTVRLGKDVVSIDAKAFEGCSSLDSIVLPEKTNRIGADAFKYCGTVELLTPNDSYHFMTTDKDGDGERDTDCTKHVTAPATVGKNQELVEIEEWNDADHDGKEDTGEVTFYRLYSKVSAVDSTNTNLTWTYNYTAPVNTTAGIINNQINWSYSLSSQTLTLSLVSGITEAALPDYTSYSNTPWADVGSPISEVVVDTGIVRIGDYSFANLTSLTSVTLKEGLQTIGEYAFSNTSLIKVTIPASMIEIERAAFIECTKLVDATQLNPATIIRSPNRELLKALAGVAGDDDDDNTGGSTGGSTGGNTGGSNNDNIGGSSSAVTGSFGRNGTWSYDRAKKRLVIYGDERNGEPIPDYTSPTSMPWASYVDQIETIDILSGITGIGNYAFYGCKALTSVSLPEGLTEIGKAAFYRCEKIVSVDTPASLTKIEDEAFYGCAALEGILFRSPSLTIGDDAFSQCSALKKAVYLSNKPTGDGVASINSILVGSTAEGDEGNVHWSVDRAAGVLTLSGSGIISSTTGWTTELAFVDTVIIGDGITAIGSELFLGQKNIKTVTIGEGVSTIGAGAFQDCTSLTSVTMPDTLSIIGAKAFYGCSSLEKITLPADLKQVSEKMFAHCTSLTSIRIGEKVTKIGAGAFDTCTSLHTVELYNTLNALSTGIFTGCSKLRTVNFNGTSGDWTRLTANADDVIKNIHPNYYVTKTIELVFEGGADDGQVAKTLTFSGKEGATLTFEIPETLGHYSPKGGRTTHTTTYTVTTEKIPYTPTKYQLSFLFLDAETKRDLLWTIDPIELTYFDAGQFNTGDLALDPELAEGYDVEKKQVVIQKGEMVADREIIIYATKRGYTYTLEYVNDETGKVIKTEEKTVKHGEDTVALTPPELEGYKAKEENKTYKLEDVKENGLKLTIPYLPKTYTLTVHYVDANGNKGTDHVGQYKYGSEVSIPSPEVAGQAPDQAVVYFEAYKGESEVTVTYSVKNLTITISFVEKDSNGHKIYSDHVAQVPYGSAYRYEFDKDTLREELGYAPLERVVDYASVTTDINRTIMFVPMEFKLTINYLDEDGELIGTDIQLKKAGEEFVLEGKEIRGYEPVEPITITMGCEDQTIDIQLVDAGMGVLGVVLIVVIIIVVLAGGALAFYFIYMKRS